jgi:hypothetical protein
VGRCAGCDLAKRIEPVGTLSSPAAILRWIH